MKLMLNCKEASELISEALEHRLPLGRRILLKMHLAMCTACANVGRQLKGIQTLMFEYISSGKSPISPSKEALPDSARKRIKNLLKNEK